MLFLHGCSPTTPVAGHGYNSNHPVSSGFLQATALPVLINAPGSEDRVNFGSPRLFGFEYARAEEVETRLRMDYQIENNIYRHPCR